MTNSLHKYLTGPALIFFVVGDILGAGIYSVTGKVAAVAGYQAWLGFVVAFIAATFTGLSYAELGSRYSNSGGEAFFSLKAFGSRHVSSFIGWMVLGSGIASMAAVAHAFAGYLSSVIPAVHPRLLVLLFILLISYINYRGIQISSRLNILCTTIEVTGLAIVILAGTIYLFGAAPNHAAETYQLPSSSASWKGAVQGAVLAFFAFIGFEDLVNVAEEVKEPHKMLPRAIILSLVITGLVYVLVVSISTSVVSPHELAASEAPLLMVMGRAMPAFPEVAFVVIALFAILNTALLNNIMASRLMYGMAGSGLLPAGLTRLAPRYRTPSYSILIVAVVTLTFASMEGLQFLAGTTSILILLVFLCMNLSLIVIKLRHRTSERKQARLPHWRCPLPIPIAGIASCMILMGFAETKEWLTVMGFAVIGLALLVLLPSDRSKQEDRT